MPSDNHSANDLFILEQLFPNAEAVFTWQPQPLDTVAKSCHVVLDTNVLLVPYTVSKESLDQIKKVYKDLVANDRIWIPGRVAREFARTRPSKLAELIQQLGDKKSKVVTVASFSYPMLEGSEEYQQVLKSREAFNESAKSYQDAIGALVNKLKSAALTDPVTDLYSEVFVERIYDPSYDPRTVEQEFRKRISHKIPPGYKDANKDDAGVGDFLIWQAILDLGRNKPQHLLFVSGEEKSDWWHKSDNSIMAPRNELVDEYRRESQGHTFHITSLSGLLKLFEVSIDVVEEVRTSEVVDAASLARDQGHLSKSIEIENAFDVLEQKIVDTFEEYSRAWSYITESNKAWSLSLETNWTLKRRFLFKFWPAATPSKKTSLGAALERLRDSAASISSLGKTDDLRAYVVFIAEDEVQKVRFLEWASDLLSQDLGDNPPLLVRVVTTPQLREMTTRDVMRFLRLTLDDLN